MTVRRVVAFVSVMALVSVIAVVGYAWSQGVRFYAVQSGSMSPTFNTGDLVIDTPVISTTVFSVGDVITFHPTPGYTATHRIAAVGPDGITTRGDANPSSDLGFIQPGMIAGRVAFSVPYGGYVAVFFQNPLGLVVLALVLVGLVVVWELTGSKPASRQHPATLDEDAP